MSNSIKEISLLVCILIITFIIYTLGIHQIEPYLDHLSKVIVIEIVALFLLIFYEGYLKHKKPQWIWKIIGKIRDSIQLENFSKALDDGNEKEIEKILKDRAINKFTSNDQEQQYIAYI